MDFSADCLAFARREEGFDDEDVDAGVGGDGCEEDDDDDDDDGGDGGLGDCEQGV